MSWTIRCTVNGASVVRDVPDRLLLLDLLRRELRLTGTHEGCAYGVCGACTVLVDGTPVRACLQLAVQVDGCAVETVEGLAAPDGTLSALQQAFADEGGLQCGYCTPGLLCSLTALGRTEAAPTVAQIDEVIGGHLCRCTGYVGIRRAAQSALTVHADVEAADHAG